MKCRTKESLNFSKLAIKNDANLLNQTRAAHLRVVRKDLNMTSPSVCCRFNNALKDSMWSSGSICPSYVFKWVSQNFGGRGHSRTSLVNGESVLLTISSKFLDDFPFRAFFISSISFLMFLRSSLLFRLGSSVYPELDCRVHLEVSSLWLVCGQWPSSLSLL